MRQHRLSGLFLGFISVCIPLSAQTKKQDKKTIIESQVKLVQIYAIIFDERGQVANGFKKQDFTVSIDGVNQQIVDCSNERESVSFVLIADHSQSMKNKIPFVRDALDSILEPFPSEEQQEKFTDQFALLVFGK